MRNPYYAPLAELRRRVLADAGETDIDGELWQAIGRVAGQAVATHNPALLASAYGLAARCAEWRGLDPANVLDRLHRKWGPPPAEPVCSACGRSFAAPESAAGWRVTEVTYPGGSTEVIAMCGRACADEIAAAGWPGYVSFLSHESLQAFARTRGMVEAPAFAASRRKRDEEKRPS